MISLRIRHWNVEQMEKVFDFLEASGVDVLRITDIMKMI